MKMTKQMRQEISNQSGFSLVELMLACAITVFVLAATYAAHSINQKSQVTQDEVAVIQQNVRAAIMTLTRDIREAGCDPKEVSGATIVVASPGQIRFTRDVSGHAVNPNDADGDVLDLNEDLIFGIDPAVDTEAVPDGIPDAALVGNLTRNDVNDGTGIDQPIAQNIERLEFIYLDEDGAVIAMPITSQADINRIRAVQVSMLVRATDMDVNFQNTSTYTTAAGTVWGPFNDNFRRRFIATTIHCRNMDLKS